MQLGDSRDLECYLSFAQKEAGERTLPRLHTNDVEAVERMGGVLAELGGRWPELHTAAGCSE